MENLPQEQRKQRLIQQSRLKREKSLLTFPEWEMFFGMFGYGDGGSGSTTDMLERAEALKKYPRRSRNRKFLRTRILR